LEIIQVLKKGNYSEVNEGATALRSKTKINLYLTYGDRSAVIVG
jgi:hypothetical protein